MSKKNNCNSFSRMASIKNILYMLMFAFGSVGVRVLVRTFWTAENGYHSLLNPGDFVTYFAQGAVIGLIIVFSLHYYAKKRGCSSKADG